MQNVKTIAFNKWFLNTLYGYSIGALIMLIPAWFIDEVPLKPVFPFGVITGLCVGYFQFRLLKGVMEVDSSWVWGYAFGFFIAKILFTILNPFLDNVLSLPDLYVIRTIISTIITGIYQTKLLNNYGYKSSSVLFITYVVSSFVVLMLPFMIDSASQYIDMFDTPRAIDYVLLVFSLSLMSATSALAIQYIQKQTVGEMDMPNGDTVQE